MPNYPTLSELSDTERADVWPRRTSYEQTSTAWSPKRWRDRTPATRGWPESPEISRPSRLFTASSPTPRTRCSCRRRHTTRLGPFASVYGACYDGIAARYQLDIARAEASAGRSKSAPAQGRTLTLRASPVHFSANCFTRQAIWPQPCVCWTRAMGSVPRAAEWTTCRAVRDRCAPSTDPW